MDVHATLVENGLEWYVVLQDDGEYALRHRSELTAILDCGLCPQEFGIEALQQCWNGDDLGEDSICL